VPGEHAGNLADVAGKHEPFNQLFARREVFEDLEVGVA
jgi:hypothetical protein